MHIQGVWEGEKRENVQSEFISFFCTRTSLYSFQLCWWKKNLSWCCPGGPCRLQSILLLGCRPTQPHRTQSSLSSQLSSGSAQICRDINKSFSPGSSGGDVYRCLQLLPSLFPILHILLAAPSAAGGTNMFSVISWSLAYDTAMRGAFGGLEQNLCLSERCFSQWKHRYSWGLAVTAADCPVQQSVQAQCFRSPLPPFVCTWDSSHLTSSIIKAKFVIWDGLLEKNSVPPILGACAYNKEDKQLCGGAHPASLMADTPWSEVANVSWGQAHPRVLVWALISTGSHQSVLDSAEATHNPYWYGSS